jgi:hypothetical protein
MKSLILTRPKRPTKSRRKSIPGDDDLIDIFAGQRHKHCLYTHTMNSSATGVCENESCCYCFSQSAANLPYKRGLYWDYNRNIISDPRDIPLDRLGKFWFLCPDCGGNIHCTLKEAKSKVKWCNNCSDGDAPVATPIVCQQGHTCTINLYQDSALVKLPCLYCDEDTEEKVYDMLIETYQVTKRPTFTWSLVNKSGEYISYNFLINNLKVFVELDPKCMNLDLKCQRAMDNGYTVILLDTYDVRRDIINWRQFICEKSRLYSTPKLLPYNIGSLFSHDPINIYKSSRRTSAINQSL